MRKQLLLSTGTICLMLASGYAFAQAPSERRDEPKGTEQPAKEGRGAASHNQERAQDSTKQGSTKQGSMKQESATKEPVRRGEERAQGQGREERAQQEQKGAAREQKGASGGQSADEKNRPATSAERNQQGRQNEQAQESRHGNRAAESAKGRESTKANAEMTREKNEKSGAQKSTVESDRSKGAATGSNRSETATGRNQRGEPAQNAAERQGAPEQGNRPASANENTRTPGTGSAQNAPSGTSSGQTQAQTNQSNQTRVDQQAQLPPEKRVRMSETFSRERLAEPERNLNISVRIGEEIPPRVRLHRLPPEVVSIEPEYRDYDYFATDDDIVIVEPRTHRIVSEIPRDPSRARAEMTGRGTMAMENTGGGGAPCRIMRRDASGNVAEVSPSTVGSTARQDSISVTVQMPGSGSSQPVALGAPAGDIVVATQGQGDCTITIEPQTR